MSEDVLDTRLSTPTIQPVASDESVYLSDLSPSDARWDDRRQYADILSIFWYRIADYDLHLRQYAVNIWNCSGRLWFHSAVDDSGRSRFVLHRAMFCRVRLCPICAWRRSLMWAARLHSALPAVLEQHPKGRFLHLTLTVKNCHIDELGHTITAMAKGWRRMSRANRGVYRPSFSRVLGWIRGVEVTRGSNPIEAHPHIHVLLFVDSSYFSGRHYLTTEAWADEWRWAMQLDYTPIVWVNAVTAKRTKKMAAGSGLTIPEDPRLAAAFAGAVEVVKYAVKPSDLKPVSETDPFLRALPRQLRRRRLVEAGGVLRHVLKAEQVITEEEMIHADDQGDLTDVDRSVKLAFSVPPTLTKKREKRRYKRDPSADVEGEI